MSRIPWLPVRRVAVSRFSYKGLILDIAATNSSALVQIILIDPKMGVDYAAVERLPHIPGGIIIDQTRAKDELERLVGENGPPLRALSGARRSRLARPSMSRLAPANRLPTLFLVHDEFAEWMLTDDYKEAVAAKRPTFGCQGTRGRYSSDLCGRNVPM